MKMVMVIYNEAIDAEVMQALDGCGIKNYSKINSTFGSGNTSGIHEGNDVWPGKNNILYIACEESNSQKLLSSIQELRKTLGKEGVKAFLLPLEKVT